MDKIEKMGDISKLLTWDSTTLLKACLVKEMVEEVTPYIKADKAEAMVNRIFDIPNICDDASFSAYDFVDALIHWPAAMPTIPLDVLMALPDDDFCMVMLAIAEKKRETYSDDFKSASSLWAERLEAIAAQAKTAEKENVK